MIHVSFFFDWERLFHIQCSHSTKFLCATKDMQSLLETTQSVLGAPIVRSAVGLWELSELAPGRSYKLQLLFAESAESCLSCDRSFDIVIDGIREIADYGTRTCVDAGHELDSGSA